MTEIKNIGELGEDDFKRWCTSCGLAATRSAPDRMGWDYFVELDPPIDPAIPLDRQNALQKALVQVKSTKSNSGSVKAKLSALKRLVDTDLPAFIVHLHYAQSAELPKVRVLHIGFAQIEAILKRVRKAEAEGRTDLHKIVMSLSLKDALNARLDNPTLPETITASIGDGVYEAEKSAFRNQCGYTTDSISAQLSFAEGVTTDAMVNLMIGTIPFIPFNQMEVVKSRFGILLNNDVDRMSDGVLSLEVRPSGTALLNVTSRSTGRRAKMIVEIFSPSIPGLMRSEVKIRLKNEFIEMILHFDSETCKMKLNFSPKKRYPVAELSNALQFCSVLSESDASLDAVLEEKGSIQFQNLPTAVDFKRWKIVHEIADLLSLAAFRHQHPATLEIAIEEIEVVISKQNEMVATLTQAGIEITIAPNQKDEFDIPERATIFAPIVLDFGEFSYMAIVRAEAILFSNEERGDMLFRSGEPRVIEDFLSSKPDLTILKERIAFYANGDGNAVRVIALDIEELQRDV